MMNKHSDSMGEKEIEVFLTHLAVERNLTVSTQNQVLERLFLYKESLDYELTWLNSMQ
jgi:hypothetical protein